MRLVSRVLLDDASEAQHGSCRAGCTRQAQGAQRALWPVYDVAPGELDGVLDGNSELRAVAVRPGSDLYCVLRPKGVALPQDALDNQLGYFKQRLDGLRHQLRKRYKDAQEGGIGVAARQPAATSDRDGAQSARSLFEQDLSTRASSWNFGESR
jgi:hypothetical protein